MRSLDDDDCIFIKPSFLVVAVCDEKIDLKSLQ